jgi:hypothetical protein
VEPEGSGIAVVREMLTSLQRGEFGKALTTHALKIPGAMLDGARLILGAKLRGRRFISEGAAVKLQFNLAQDRPSCSRMMLGRGRGCDGGAGGGGGLAGVGAGGGDDAESMRRI